MRSELTTLVVLMTYIHPITPYTWSVREHLAQPTYLGPTFQVFDFFFTTVLECRIAGSPHRSLFGPKSGRYHVGVRVIRVRENEKQKKVSRIKFKMKLKDLTEIRLQTARAVNDREAPQML